MLLDYFLRLTFDQSFVKKRAEFENDFYIVVPFKFYVEVVLTASPELDDCSVLGAAHTNNASLVGFLVTRVSEIAFQGSCYFCIQLQ